MSGERHIRVGVVGCGQMGRKHALNCLMIPGVSVAAVSDIDNAQASALSADTGAKAYASFGELLERTPLDAVIVATPPTERRHIVELAAAKRVAVFVEKPIALEMAPARAMLEAVKNAGVVNSVGFHLRYCPLASRAKDLMAGRRVTNVRTVTTTSYYLKLDMPDWFLQRRHSGGPLLEQSLHMFDMARYLAGDITSVTATGGRLIRPDLKQYDSEDTMVLAYRFASSALGTHTDSAAMQEFNWEAEFLGPDWRLLVDFARKKLHGHIEGKPIEMGDPDTDMHVLEMQAFIDAVRRGNPAGVLCDFAAGTGTLAVMLAGDRSLKSGVWEKAEA